MQYLTRIIRILKLAQRNVALQYLDITALFEYNTRFNLMQEISILGLFIMYLDVVTDDL